MLTKLRGLIYYGIHSRRGQQLLILIIIIITVSLIYCWARHSRNPNAQTQADLVARAAAVFKRLLNLFHQGV
ncbi:hypothetical protein B807_778 [Fructilactobacillus florum 2F]|nr:hypothetical protein B807_778 [Fructilactobacillus florum 2F]